MHIFKCILTAQGCMHASMHACTDACKHSLSKLELSLFKLGFELVSLKMGLRGFGRVNV